MKAPPQVSPENLEEYKPVKEVGNVFLEWAKILTPIAAGLLLYYGTSLIKPINDKLQMIDARHHQYEQMLAKFQEHTTIYAERYANLVKEVDALKLSLSNLRTEANRHAIEHARAENGSSKPR